MILAFETSTDVCSVAFQNPEGEIFEKRIQGRSVHSDHLFLFTRQLVDEHALSMDQIETVLVSNGPGSYTGLRIAASAVKGIFFQSKVNVIAVDTLAGFAASFLGGKSAVIHSIIDARRTHVYHQQFELGEELTQVSGLTVIEISELEEKLEPGQKIIGTGLSRVNPARLKGIEVFDSDYISAANLIRLYNHQPVSGFFENTTLEALDPNYFTSSQVNNTS